MKHLRKFNEAYSDECTFEDFKDIMLDILDEFNFEYDFTDYSSKDDFYDCLIYVLGLKKYSSQQSSPWMNIAFLDYNNDDVLPPRGSPQEITNIRINDCISSINQNINDLETLKGDLDDIIKFQNDCVKLFESIKVASERFKGFSNCDSCSIGFDYGKLRILFDIKKQYKKNETPKKI